MIEDLLKPPEKRALTFQELSLQNHSLAHIDLILSYMNKAKERIELGYPTDSKHFLVSSLTHLQTLGVVLSEWEKEQEDSQL